MNSSTQKLGGNVRSMRREKTRRLVMLALFTALTILLACVPYLGYITIGPFSMVTTHIPVIIGAIILGPAAGAFLGLIFGIFSLIQAPMIQPLTAFVFNPFVPFGNFGSVIIAIVPRIMIGIVAAYLYRLVKKADKRGYFASLAAGIGGALTNTILVLGGVYIVFGHQYATVCKVPYDALLKALLTVVATNGIFEAVFAAVAVTAVTKALFVVMRRK